MSQTKNTYLGLIFALVLCLGMLAFASACTSSSTGGVQETSDSRVTYEDKTLTVALEENGSTGYIWSVTKEGTALTELDDEYVSDADEDEQMAGAGGTHTYRFEGSSEGTTTLSFVNSQPWEPKEDDEKLTIEVKTKADGTIETVTIL
ncbi:MAG: protease inhibitor I42 family protein [Raoultibacter sp.]|jgi:predicted secreted protein